MKSGRDFLIITNNPLVNKCLGDYYEIRFEEDKTYREVLIEVRDLVFAGHKLYTHPLCGSVKPNETPYRSVVLSKKEHGLDAQECEIMSNAVITFDKFTPRNRVLSEKVYEDFQMVDYSLLCSALDFDAVAGLSKLSQI